MTKLLILLLAFRVVGAPLSPNTQRPGVPHHAHWSMRLRSWPPQQLQRFSSRSKLLRLYQGKNKPAPDVTAGVLADLPTSPTPLPSPSLDPTPLPGWNDNRPTDRLRC